MRAQELREAGVGRCREGDALAEDGGGALAVGAEVAPAHEEGGASATKGGATVAHRATEVTHR